MKPIEEILNNYSYYEVALEDRFGVRFCDFLTEEQGKQIGFKCSEGYTWGEPKEWTEGNILKQLKEDVEFAIEKMKNQRGISSSLMHEVVHSWMKVLEDEEMVELLNEDYIDYGLGHMKAVAEKYKIKI